MWSTYRDLPLRRGDTHSTTTSTSTPAGGGNTTTTTNTTMKLTKAPPATHGIAYMSTNTKIGKGKDPIRTVNDSANSSFLRDRDRDRDGRGNATQVYAEGVTRARRPATADGASSSSASAYHSLQGQPHPQSAPQSPQQQYQQPRSRNRGSLLVAAASDALNFTLFGSKRRSPSSVRSSHQHKHPFTSSSSPAINSHSSAAYASNMAFPDVIEISAPRRDAEDEERDRLRAMAAQAIGLDPYVNVGSGSGSTGASGADEEDQEEEVEGGKYEYDTIRASEARRHQLGGTTTGTTATSGGIGAALGDGSGSSRGLPELASISTSNNGHMGISAPPRRSPHSSSLSVTIPQPPHNHNHSHTHNHNHNYNQNQTYTPTSSRLSHPSQPPQQQQPESPAPSNNSHNNNNNNTSRFRSGSISMSTAAAATQRGHSPSNSMTMAPIPPYPCTVSSLTPFRDSAAIYPKYYPPSSLRIFALSKNWKNRFVILSSPATLVTKGSLPAVSYLHLFKGQGEEEKEMERLEINEDSVVFVEEEEVGGKRSVIKVGGADVGARRREWVVEEGGHVMWLLQIVDQSEAQRWITSIKNAILGQRTVRAGLIPPLSLGNNEPRGDMDVMLSIRAATSSYKNNINTNSVTTSTPTHTHTSAHTNTHTNTSGNFNTGSSPPAESAQPYYASSISSHSVRSQSTTTHPHHTVPTAINTTAANNTSNTHTNANNSHPNTPTTATPSKPPASPTSAVFAPLKGLFTSNRPRSTSHATSISSTSSFRAMLSSAADDNTSVSNYSYHSAHTPGVNGAGNDVGGSVGGQGGFSFASRGSNLLSMLRSSPSPGPGLGNNVTADTRSIHTIHSQTGGATPRPMTSSSTSGMLLPFGAGTSTGTGRENATRIDRKIIQDHHQQPYLSSWSSASPAGSSSTVYHPHAASGSPAHVFVPAAGAGVEVTSSADAEEEDADAVGRSSSAANAVDVAGTGGGEQRQQKTKDRRSRGLSLGAAMSLQPPPRKRWTSSGIVEGSTNSATAGAARANAGVGVGATEVGGGSGGSGRRKTESARRVSFSPSRASVEYDRVGGGSGVAIGGGSSSGNGAGGAGEDGLAGFQFGTPEQRPRAPSIQSVSTYASGSAEHSNAQSHNNTSNSNSTANNDNSNSNGNANANGTVERSSSGTKRSSRTSARRWSRQGQGMGMGMGGMLPTRLTPPSEPPPAVPALDTVRSGSAHGRSGSGHPYANAGNGTGNGSAQSSEKSFVSSLPAFSKRASAGSTYSVSTTYSQAMSVASSLVSPSSAVSGASHSPHSAVGGSSGGLGSATGSPSHQRHSPSSHRSSMPPPPRPAPTSALPPAPSSASPSASTSASAAVTGGGDVHHQDALAALEGNHTGSAGKASSTSSPASASTTSSSFRHSLAHRPFRLSLAQAPKPPPMATLPPRPDEVKHNNATGTNQSNTPPPNNVSPSEKKKTHRRASSGGIGGTMLNTSTKLEPIPASPVPAAKSLVSSPFPPPVGPLPPTPPSTSSTSGTVNGTGSNAGSSINAVVPPQQDPAVQAAASKRTTSIKQRLRNLSSPQPFAASGVKAPQLRARSHTNQHNSTTVMTNNANAHVYAYSPPSTPIAEKITLFQNDPSFLQMHTPVLSSLPPPPFAAIAAATAATSAQNHQEQEPVDDQLDGIVSLLPPPRRGSKQLFETELPSTSSSSASASASALVSAPEVEAEAVPSQTEPAPRVLGMKLSIVGGGNGIARSSNAPRSHLSLSRPGSALSNHSRQSDTFLEIDWEPSPKDDVMPRDEYPPIQQQQHEKHQSNMESHLISLSRPGSVVSLEVMAM